MVGLTSKQMSNLYYKMVSKGINRNNTFQIVGNAKRLSMKGRNWKFKNKHAYKDYDGDGKVNKYDCQPLNYWKQDDEDVYWESDAYFDSLDERERDDDKRMNSGDWQEANGKEKKYRDGRYWTEREYEDKYYDD